MSCATGKVRVGTHMDGKALARTLQSKEAIGHHCRRSLFYNSRRWRDAVSSRLALACAVVFLLVIPAVAQLSAPQQPPALVGTWVLHVPNSKVLPLPDIKSQTIAITCVGEKVEISATTNGEESFTQFTADGKRQKGRTIPPLSHGEVVTARWEGTSLVLTIVSGSWVTGQPTTTERWTPSLDGHTLTRSWGGFKMLAMVYDKRPAQ
jgi:hypothetical protein